MKQCTISENIQNKFIRFYMQYNYMYAQTDTHMLCILKTLKKKKRKKKKSFFIYKSADDPERRDERRERRQSMIEMIHVLFEFVVIKRGEIYNQLKQG